MAEGSEAPAKFGLTVRPGDRLYGPSGGKLSRDKDADHWCVYMPHQCDSWDIAGDEYGNDGVPREDAVRLLEAFVAEASAALAALRQGQAFGDERGAW